LNPALRILIVAYAFPPSAEVGQNRIVRFCKYLPEFGIQPVVLTVESRFYNKPDYTAFVPPGVRVIRTEQHATPLNWYASWKSRNKSLSSNHKDTNFQSQMRAPPLPNRWRRHLLSSLSIPDEHWGWYFPAKRVGRQLLQAEKFDLLLSTAPPFTDHLIAHGLKKKCQIPWIIDFRDPWVDNSSLILTQPTWRRRLDRLMEASVVKSSDLVICNTNSQREVMSRRYNKLPAKKFVALTNGFDDDEIPSNVSLKKNKPLLCLHLGNVYGDRRIDTFCASLSALVKNQKLSPEAIKVMFVGHTVASQIEACRQVSSELLDRGIIEFHERMDKSEANRLLWQADLLLIFQGQAATQIPFKFYEYLPTGKPIFAVTTAGALNKVMEQTGAGICVEQDDINEIGQKFLLALSLPAQQPEEVRRRWAKHFHFRSLSSQLATWIREMVNERRVVQAIR
jgi:glycosyltransferase involved in cell wall biosynthesis